MSSAIVTAAQWTRRNLFSSWFNGALTVAAVLFLVVTVPPLLDWAVIDAAWTGTGGKACPDKDAACWVFIRARFSQFVYGGYPLAEERAVMLNAMRRAMLQALPNPMLKQCTAVMHGRTDERTNGERTTQGRSSRLTLRPQGGWKIDLSIAPRGQETAEER